MADISDLNLDPASRKELEQFIETQQAQTRVQTQVHMLTDMCWDKCVGSISSSFSRSEQSCLANCVDRFLDTSLYLVKKVEDQRAALGQH
ncbi:Tim10/DDP family zinc finger-domain-containing protein [Trametes polyzona]|nr:Tim10/DDP family zinc finger-domain-containing protein [Trametes polyzona]